MGVRIEVHYEPQGRRETPIDREARHIWSAVAAQDGDVAFDASGATPEEALAQLALILFEETFA